MGVQIVSGVLAREHVHMFVVFSNLKVIKVRSLGVSVRLGVGPPPSEPPDLQTLEEVGLPPAVFLNACLRTAHAMGGVRRRADFVGERR